jgi:predicted DNA binding CopG/RHH family protein
MVAVPCGLPITFLTPVSRSEVMETTKKESPTRGRPAKEESTKLTRSINLKLTKDDFDAITEKATSVGMKPTQYARQMVLNGRIKPRYTKEDLDLRRKIAGMANNLNQLTHRANRYGFYEAGLDVYDVLKQVKKMLDDR